MSTHFKQTSIAAAAVALIATPMVTKAETKTGGPEEAYISPSAAVPTGKAPGMKFRLLSESGGVKRYSIVLSKV